MAPAPPAPPGPATDAASAAVVAELDLHFRRALELSLTGRPAQAARAVREVRRRAGSSRDPGVLTIVARTYITEAAAHLDITGDTAGALELLDQAETLAAELGSSALMAIALAQRSLLVLRSGDTRAALRAFNGAAALIDEMAPRDQALVMLNRGVLHLEHADLALASDDLARSVVYAGTAGDARLQSMAQHNLGYVDFLAGRIPRALSAYERAAETWPEQAHPAMQLDHARGLREAGLLREADEVLARVGETCRRARLFQDLGETELVRAECALALRDPQAARAFAVAARRRFERRGNVRWQRKAELVVLRCDRAAVDLRGARSRRTALLALADRCDALAADCHRELRPDLARAADLLATECRLRAGQGVAAPARVRAVDPLPTRLQVREVRALRAVHDGDQARALREVRRGLAELGSFQGGLGSLDLRTAGAVHGVALARLGLGIAVERGSASRVLEMVERSRAISTRLPQVRPPDDDATARMLGELRQVEEEARGLEGDPLSVGAVARLRVRAAALQRDIRARAWEREGDASSVDDAPRLTQLRERARAAGSVFVTYARHEGTWLAVVVRPGRSALVPLAPAAEVAELVRRVRADLDALAMPHLPGPLADAVRGSVSSGLRRLDDLLLAPLGVAGASLVLSCSGPLAVLPWSLLPSRAGLPTVVTPGAGTWLRSQGVARPARPRVVALAGPGLHESEREARGVAATWTGAELLAGEDATTASARAALARADLLHVAAHGTHRHDSPLFSSVRLADGPLYAYELDPAAGVPGCVTLSACEAGLATLRPGDEGLGLTHVLLHLGVPSVVAGVARVRDDVAAATMAHVHRAMAAGASSAEALAGALAETRDAEAPAPFVAFGAAW